LVSTHETFRLNLRSGTARQLFIETDYSLHANSILRGANALFSLVPELLPFPDHNQVADSFKVLVYH
jgi:hypothetical protein